ncbi:MAG: hypothetical protein RBT78_09235 [Kiritimatiellia bacterium]|nr:hypothetical protein [Kiritimatiellia bacterium]
MRNGLIWMATVLMAAGLARAETVSLVQITDMRGQTGFEILNREEYAALQKEIKEETAAYAVAAAESRKQWEADKENKLPFPGSKIKPRTARKMGADFQSREKAEAKKSRLEERASEKQLEEMDKESKQKKLMKDEDLAKEANRVKTFEDALAMISKRMAEKLGRPVPAFGMTFGEPAKDDAKKDEKKEEKKPAGGH